MLKRLILTTFIILLLLFVLGGITSFAKNNVDESEQHYLSERVECQREEESVNKVKQKQLHDEHMPVVILFTIAFIVAISPMFFLMWETLLDLFHISKRLDTLV